MKQIDVTIRVASYDTYRVEVEDDFDPENVDDIEDIEEWPQVASKVRDWSIVDAREVTE